MPSENQEPERNRCALAVNVHASATGPSADELGAAQLLLQRMRQEYETTIEALRTAHAYAEAIVHTIREPLLILTSELRVKSANDSFYSYFGVTPEQTEGRLLYELGNHQWDIPALRTLLEEVLPDNRVFNDFVVTHAFERLGQRTLAINARRLDQLPLILLAIEDITERLRAEAAWHEGEVHFRQVWETTSDALALSNAEGTVLAVNPAYLDLYGYTSEQVIGQSFALIFSEDQRAGAITQYKRIFASAETPPNFESVIRRADGSARVVEARATFMTVRGQRTAMLSTIRDITERRQMEEALRQSEERYRLLVESAQEYAIFMLDLGGRITTWNTGAERVFGYSEAEAVGQSGAMLFTEEDQAAGVPEAELATANREGRAADDRWQRRKDGTHFWASGMTEALRHPDGRRRGFVKVLRDNTQQRQTEEALRQFNESLETQVEERTRQVRELVSQLTLSEQAERQRIAQVLHDDLQQRLYGCRYQLLLLQDVLDDQTEVRRAVAEIEKTLQESVQLTRNLSVDLSPPVLAGEGLADAIGWLASQMARRHGLTVHIQAPDALPVPYVELRVLLFQAVREALFNIVKHARVSEATVILHHDNDQLRIEISDQGAGFDVGTILNDVERSHGLLQNQRRLALIGGWMQIQSSPTTGTHVVLICPLS